MADITINVNANTKDAEKQIGNLGKSIASKGSIFGNILGAGLAMKGISMLSNGLQSLGGDMFEATKQYQGFGTVLDNVFQSTEKASTAMAGLQEIAKTTPFEFKNLADAYVKMANRGVTLTKDQIIGIGDTAAALGKPFEQVNEAILDISNSKRWTEIGIKSAKVGDKIALTWKGVTKTVEQTEASVAQAITEFGNMTGVKNTMDKLSKTLDGTWSNMKDSMFIALGKIGDTLAPMIIPLIQKLSGFVQDSLPYIIEYIKYFGNLFGVIGKWFSELSGTDIFKSLISGFKNAWGLISNVVGQIISIVSNLFTALTDPNNSFGKFINTLINYVGTVFNTIKSMATFIGGIINWLIDTLANSAFGKIIQTIFIDPLIWLFDKLTSIVKFFGTVFNKLNTFFGFGSKEIKLPEVKVSTTGDTKEQTLSKFDALAGNLTNTNTNKPVGANDNSGSGTSKSGKSTQSVVINIDNIIKEVQISTTQDVKKITSLVKNAVLTALADVQTI